MRTASGALAALTLLAPLATTRPALAQTPSNDFRSYAVIAGSQIKLGSGALVLGGNAAVTNADGTLMVGKGASCPVLGDAVGDRAKLLNGANVGRLFSNEPLLKDGSSINSGGPFPVTLPITFPNLPAFPSAVAGTQAVEVAAGDTVVLGPGLYGSVSVGVNATLVLRGLSAGSGVGRYGVASVKIGTHASLLADNPVILNVAGRFSAGGSSTVAPSQNQLLAPGDFQINVAGPAAKVGGAATVSAYLRVPTGKIGVSPGGELDGRAIATRVAIGKHAQVIRGGVCGDGTLSVGEQCDVSAANGDAACPGKCVAGDPQGLGNIANGSPGQCRCSCTTDAQCSDGNQCNGTEKCQNNICVPGDPPNCDDNNPCTTDCDPSKGCLSPGEPRPDGSGCSDNNLCTAGDECQSGQCVSGQARDCDDKNSCTTDSCDPTLGCQHVALPTGSSCEDGSLCTTGDSCIRGVCVGGPPPNCDDSNPCTASTCVPDKGCVPANVANGTPCPSPSNPCSAKDTCVQGACTSGVATLCSDSNPCTADGCNVVGTPTQPSAVCTHGTLPNFTSCGPNGAVCFNGVCQ